MTGRRAMIRAAHVLALALLVGACGPQPAAAPLEKVSVLLDWTHQAQFAGMYVADQKGWYAEEGLQVMLLPRSEPTADLLAPLAEGAAQFGIVEAVLPIRARAAGKPIVALAAVYQRNPSVFITLADSGITRPQDFAGHTMRALQPGAGGDMAFRGMMARLGLDAGSVKQVKTGFDLAPFLTRQVDIWPGFIFDQVLTLRQQGHQVNLIIPDDYGVHFYGDLIATTGRLIEERPDLVLRFLRATLRGWRWAVENPADAGPLALKYDPSLDAAQQAAAMEASVPLIHTGVDPIGWMAPDVWQQTQAMLLAQGLLAQPVDLDAVFTMRFLEQVYGKGEKE